MRPGDQVTVRACGQGWRPPRLRGRGRRAEPGPCRVFEVLPITAGDDDGVTVTAGVRMTVPSKLAGNGIGRPSIGWDLDLQLGVPFRLENGSSDPAPEDLLLGDLVAVSDLDARYNMGFRRGWLTVGVVVHGASPLPGHGPGITPILTGPAGALRARPDGAEHAGLTEAALQRLGQARSCHDSDGQCAGRSGPILEHVSLPEAVSRALRRRILNNELPADSRLVEASLAAEFGVSRGTIRDAMRSLHAEGLIAIVPRRYSVVTRMSPEDAEDVCYARYVLEDASLRGGLGPRPRKLAKALHLALEHMSVAARLGDMDALVDSDTRFHEVLIDRLRRTVSSKDLWSITNSQMGALMRAEIERQGISMEDTAGRHVGLADAAAEAVTCTRLRAELRAHYLVGFPQRPGWADTDHPDAL